MKVIKNFIALEKADKIVFFLLITNFGNALMAIIKLIFGLSIPSLWFFVNAVFGIILVISRIVSIKDYRKMRLETDIYKKRNIGYSNYIDNGIILIILGIAYFAVSMYLYFKGTNTNMHEFLTYLVAFYAFYSIGSAIYRMCKYRKNNNPIIAGVKITSFANALTSIVLTQVVLLNTFGGNIDTRIINGLVGMSVSIIIMGLGLYMIVSITKYKDLL